MVSAWSIGEITKRGLISPERAFRPSWHDSVVERQLPKLGVVGSTSMEKPRTPIITNIL